MIHSGRSHPATPAPPATPPLCTPPTRRLHRLPIQFPLTSNRRGSFLCLCQSVSGWTRCAIQVCRRRTKQEIPDWGLEKGERRRADDQTPPRQILGMGAYMYSRRLLLLLFGLAPAASIEYFSSTGAMTQSDAKDWCAWNGGELAVIKSADENDDAQAACGSKTCWIGLEEDDDYSGEWYWADGTMASAIYTNWESGEPNNYGGQDEKFAMMHCCGTSTSSTGKWYDAPGTYDEPVALCSNKSPTVLPVPVPTMLPTLAPTRRRSYMYPR